MSTGIEPQKGSETGGEIRDLVSAAAKSIDPVKIEVPVERTPKALSEAPAITIRRRRPAGSRWGRRLVVLTVLALGGGAAAFYYDPIREKLSGAAGPKTAVALANIQTYSAKRGELRITMVEEGKLRAVNNSTIRMGVNGKITWLADAGSRVKKGDKLATIDVKQYEDQKKTMEADYETQAKQLEIAEKQVPIAEADGRAAVSTAENALRTAQVALTTFTTVEVPKKLNEMEGLINEARSKLADQSKKRVDYQTQLDQMLNEGKEKTDLQNNLAIAKQTELSLRRALQTNEDQHKVFRSYNYPQELQTKERLIQNAKVDVNKAKVKAENDVLAKQADVQRIRNSMTRIQNNIKQYDDIISKATAYAPTDGLVFYGGQDARYGGMSPDQIRVGADWYSQYPIMSIPDLSSFAVDVPIAEVYRGRVSTGMTTSVTIDAVPGLALEGKLTTVSSVSRPKYQYDNTSPPVYDATIALAVADERMVAGMTVRVEIVTATLKDVLFVPVEAVYNEEGKTAAFFWVEGEKPGEGHIEIRPVLTGQSSDHFVEIKQGVRENEKLLLSRPAAYVTPANYRELADAMFPADAGPTSKPAVQPAIQTPPPQVATADIPTTRPTARRGRGGASTMPAGSPEPMSAGQIPIVR